ncbi:MAG: hypothetical protein LUJ25_00595 [Firmicutes bacterium]|nr:hypothetical protein [Bacillota bacterium]
MYTYLVGSRTTGADGNISLVDLPGLGIFFTGLGVYYPDKEEIQRMGIVLDREVKPTIRGFREGRDEILEAAVNYILQD